MSQSVDFNSLLPTSLKNETLTSLVSNLFNRFVSSESSSLIAGRVGTLVPGDAVIQAPSLERQENALVPGLTFAAGTEKYVYTFQDMIDKLAVLDIDETHLREWIAEQWYNLAPPINYDKFINYSNYYWVAAGFTAGTGPSWNPNWTPEYYVIRQPLPNDPQKLPVDLATTRNVNLWINDRPTETFTITFTSATTFTVQSSLGSIIVNTASLANTVPGDSTHIVLSAYNDVPPSISAPGPAGQTYQVAEFYIVNGSKGFSVGDNFTVTITYYTSTVTIALNSFNVVNKGIINGVNTALCPTMYIDGTELKGGERILVWNQTDPTQNAIYIASKGARWQFAIDSSFESNWPLGATVFVKGGATYANTLFTLTGKTNTSGIFGTGELTSKLTFTPGTVGAGRLNVNDWQTGNYWVHRADLPLYANLGYTLATSTQAQRPIIEYDSTVKLNDQIDPTGAPTDTGAPNYAQTKSRLNQLPQFNLYRYDGTHSGSTSGIFFYQESALATTDAVLHRRLDTTANGDFIFGLGLLDSAGRYLYYRDSGALKGPWRPGPAVPTVSTITVTGASNGTAVVTPVGLPDNQHWTLTATSASTFSVVGGRSGTVGTATVGTAFTCDDFTLTINAGSTAFAAGDTITFSIAAPLAPRYVGQLSNGSIINYPGGYAADAAAPTQIGAWLNPLRFFQNVERETRESIAYGDFLNHGRSTLLGQDGFTGASFGNNNSRNLINDRGLGGTIREFSSNFPLLASMLIEPDLSPITFLNFAEQQYNTAISSVDTFIVTQLANYLATRASVTVSTINPTDPGVLALTAYFESLRGQDANLTAVFSDSTALVTNWPATLPMLGLLPAVVPGLVFDFELSTTVIRHHDGHISVPAVRDITLDRALVSTPVPRSDGSQSPGTFSQSLPSQPYARQLWMVPSTLTLYVFDVAYDTSAAPATGTAGQYWYNRSSNALYQWNTATNSWVASSATVASRWTILDTAGARNSVLLAIENKLYASVHPLQQVNLNLASALSPQFSAVELARYAAKYNYDTYAPDYVATNAFTWNYSQASLGVIASGPARWYTLYQTYLSAFPGVFPTDRPDLEPWKLLGHATQPAGFAAQYASTNPGSATTTTARVVSTAPLGTLFGALTIDQVSLSAGDVVLLVGQTLPQQNGLYTVSTGGWTRTTDALVNQLTVSVTEGYAWTGSTWSITTTDPITASVTPIAFQQVRTWLPQLWTDVQAYYATLTQAPRLLVNINTDALLPPYVAPGLFTSSAALLNTIPAGVSNSYQFGDLGPVELVWSKSLEFGYGLARDYFRTKPLEFLDKGWGETYIQAGDNLRVERNLMASLPASKFLLHGERLNITNTFTPADVAARFSGTLSATAPTTVTFKVTHCGNNLTAFTVTEGATFVATVVLGTQFTLITPLGTTFSATTIRDLGIALEVGDTFTVSFDAASNVTYAHTAAAAKVLKGVGQWFTNLLRYSYIDTDVSTAALAFRGWSVELIHRLGTLIRPDSLTVGTYQGQVPTTGYNVQLKRSVGTQSLWISALRVQLVQMGSMTLTAGGYYAPKTDASDWVFRLETYNPEHPVIEYHDLDTGGDFQTFYALNQRSTSLAWNRYLTVTDTKTATTPIIVTGLQNLLNLIYGYTTRLDEMGWKLNSTDIPATDLQTGRNINWQLEIEKLIDTVYSGMSTGQGVILNPFMQALYLQTPDGLASRFTNSNFSDAYSTQAVFDVTGVVIPTSNLAVIRTDDQCVTYSTTPIFSAHMFIDEFEHTIVFNRQFSSDPTSAVIFDPFLGERLQTAYLTYTGKLEADNKPTFDGFFLSGDTVARNITSSIDGISTFYDAGKTFSESTQSSHALALLGFQQRAYFDNINITPAVQLDFWRGMIHAKGTNLTIDAFTNYKSFQNASVDEFWAYKLAEYGDARERTMPEIKINPIDVSRKFAQFQFYSNTDTTYAPLPLFIQVEATDDTRWFSIDDLGTTLRFEAQAISETVVAGTAGYYTLQNIYHNGDAAAPTVSPSTGATIISAQILKVTTPGTYTVSGFTWLNPVKFSPIKLYDYEQHTLDITMGLWHPAIGIHAYEPLEVVNITTNTDPAHYNYTTLTTDNPNYVNLKPWATREVGRVWWDTSNLDYIPYHDATIFPNRETRNSRWGSLAEYASVDLYEWVESDYHPSAYNAAAAAQEGDSTIDQSIRLSGTVGFNNYYSRQRSIFIYPIAWSEAGVGNGSAHPAFVSSNFVAIYASGNKLIADTGTTAAAGLTAGTSFGGWDSLRSVPVGEALVGATISYDLGSSTVTGQPSLTPTDLTVLTSIVAAPITNSTIFGTRLGQLTLANLVSTTGVSTLRLLDATGFYQDVVINDWYSGDLTSDSTQTYTFDQFGIQITATRTAVGTINAATLVATLTNPTNDLFIREAVGYTEVIPLPTAVGGIFINDTTDPRFSTAEYGWRAWTIPTQAQLTADLAAPYNQWLPYVGDPVQVTATPAVVAAMTAAGSTFTLAAGTVINRYTTTWSAWSALTRIKLTAISDGVNPVSVTVPGQTTLDTTRLSLYANGTQLSPASYVTAGGLVTAVNSVTEGTTITVLYRPYQPTAADLAFDPTVAENYSIQTQYKQDYQYTELEVRDSSGNVTGSKYYFWVKDKTIPQVNQTMSLVQATQLLQYGQDTYTLLCRALPTATGASFDSCAVAGLSVLVTKNDAYKLRFLRDFTLRDDPEELNLKNVHTEWQLIRQHQSDKIPATLWLALTNAVCGQDAGGNPLPSKVRTDYDARNGTMSRFGFGPGQIFADTALVTTSVINTLLNTSLTITAGDLVLIDYVSALNITASTTDVQLRASYFSTPASSRQTMTTIYTTARASQVNEIFFRVLNDALANNYEFTDLFKTSLLTLNSSTKVIPQAAIEQLDEFF